MSLEPSPDNSKRQRELDTKRRSNQKTKQRRKDRVLPERPKWGTYNILFPTNNKKGILELQHFLNELDTLATWPNTQDDNICRVAENIRPENSTSVLEILNRLPVQLSSMPEVDIIYINNSTHLQELLKTDFNKPLFHRAQSTFQSLGARTMTLSQFLDYMKNNVEKTIDVYDYSVDNPSSRTRKIPVEDALLHWEDQERKSALNFLDIENRFGDFCPSEIIQCDLYQQSLERQARTVGKSSLQEKKIHQEFFLLSEANAISSIHVDVAGQLTWVLILEGRKIWYYPKKITLDAVRWAGYVGSQYAKCYPGDWIRVELQAGDLLIMPPNCPHAVFTPEDCLAVGGHFYTSAHLGSSLGGLDMQEKNPGVSNESIERPIYDKLSAILDSFDIVGTDSEVAQAFCNCSTKKHPQQCQKFNNSLRKFRERCLLKWEIEDV